MTIIPLPAHGHTDELVAVELISKSKPPRRKSIEPLTNHTCVKPLLDSKTSNLASRPVTSNQNGVHRHLVNVVRKHQHSNYARPIAEHSKTHFEHTDRIVNQYNRSLILDSGCGNGESSHVLASVYPNHLVIGLDKSAIRIGRANRAQGNANLLFVRGDCVDFWRLATAAQWPVERHFLLYPNPWPKAKHLQRRWHGHAVFNSLVALGGLLELRSNWKIYVDEFSSALTILGIKNDGPQAYLPAAAASQFERKYLLNRHPLYRLIAQLGSSAD